jgi:ABC-type cobalamin transport system permease subunit
MIGMIDPITTLVLISGEFWFQTSEHVSNSYRILIHEVPLHDVIFMIIMVYRALMISKSLFVQLMHINYIKLLNY